MKKLVLLDGNSLINRAFFALPPMSDNKGRLTHAVYGFVSMLIRIINELKPTHMAAAFDLKGPTFRHIKFEDYKATRKPMPDELGSQLPILKELLRAMDIHIAEKTGYEADDIIGAIAQKTPFETVIVSGDRDTLQLVSDTTRVWLTRKGISNVSEYDLISLKEEGFTPEMIIELKALMGDSSDNIPGVPGIGEKTATTLLNKYGNLDEIYNNINEIQGKLKDKLTEGRELAYLSRELATIDLNAITDLNLSEMEFHYPFKKEVQDMLVELGFRSIISRLEFNCVIKVETTGETVIIKDLKELRKLNEIIARAGKTAVFLDSDFHIAVDTKTEYVISPSDDLLGELRFEQIINELNTLADPEIKKIAFDYKGLKKRIKELQGLTDDLMLKYYVANAGSGAEKYGDLLSAQGMCGKYPAIEMLIINENLEKKIFETDTADLYYKIEIPLISVLYDMEETGFKADKAVLEELYANYSEILNELTAKIYAMTNKQFNINSSRQLQDVLFNDLHLPSLKKSKTGFSLSGDVLVKMKKMHPVIDLIIRYRHISKLISTYIEGFRYQIGADCRIHTVFKQAATATGRLSSTEPNLQNLPIRDEMGREIRRMFIASEGNELICADYSQIELRLLAHFSLDPKLINSYLSGEDIHARTAAEIFKVGIDEVTPEMRRNAKAVNFGIIYGISSFGLSENADISVKEAKAYIDKYFETYPKVQEYMNKNVETAKATGRIKTITGRLRFIPELMSSNYNIRSFGERAAMNMPLQGSAADIIKIAMINVCKALKKNNLKSRLILQIHDELVVDAPVKEKEAVIDILKEEMEGAVALRVPLVVDISSGKSLYETK
ncbi:MAG: DNA polymerase I [Christensenellales bacterium]